MGISFSTPTYEYKMWHKFGFMWVSYQEVILSSAAVVKKSSNAFDIHPLRAAF